MNPLKGIVNTPFLHHCVAKFILEIANVTFVSSGSISNILTKTADSFETAAYFTRPHKDRLPVLEFLQNTDDLRFQFGTETILVLRDEKDTNPTNESERVLAILIGV